MASPSAGSFDDLKFMQANERSTDSNMPAHSDATDSSEAPSPAARPRQRGTAPVDQAQGFSPDANQLQKRKRRKRPAWSLVEESILAEQHAQHGNAWLLIAKSLPGRSPGEIKNIYNSTLRGTRLGTRSLLRAYIMGVRGRESDDDARHKAFQEALTRYERDGQGTSRGRAQASLSAGAGTGAGAEAYAAGASRPAGCAPPEAPGAVPPPPLVGGPLLGLNVGNPFAHEQEHEHRPQQAAHQGLPGGLGRSLHSVHDAGHDMWQGWPLPSDWPELQQAALGPSYSPSGGGDGGGFRSSRAQQPSPLAGQAPQGQPPQHFGQVQSSPQPMLLSLPLRLQLQSDKNRQLGLEQEYQHQLAQPLHAPPPQQLQLQELPAQWQSRQRSCSPRRGRTGQPPHEAQAAGSSSNTPRVTSFDAPPGADQPSRHVRRSGGASASAPAALPDAPVLLGSSSVAPAGWPPPLDLGQGGSEQRQEVVLDYPWSNKHPRLDSGSPLPDPLQLGPMLEQTLLHNILAGRKRPGNMGDLDEDQSGDDGREGEEWRQVHVRRHSSTADEEHGPRRARWAAGGRQREAQADGQDRHQDTSRSCGWTDQEAIAAAAAIVRRLRQPGQNPPLQLLPQRLQGERQRQGREDQILEPSSSAELQAAKQRPHTTEQRLTPSNEEHQQQRQSLLPPPPPPQQQQQQQEQHPSQQLPEQLQRRLQQVQELRQLGQLQQLTLLLRDSSNTVEQWPAGPQKGDSGPHRGKEATRHRAPIEQLRRPEPPVLDLSAQGPGSPAAQSPFRAANQRAGPSTSIAAASGVGEGRWIENEEHSAKERLLALIEAHQRQQQSWRLPTVPQLQQQPSPKISEILLGPDGRIWAALDLPDDMQLDPKREERQHWQLTGHEESATGRLDLCLQPRLAPLNIASGLKDGPSCGVHPGEMPFLRSGEGGPAPSRWEEPRSLYSGRQGTLPPNSALQDFRALAGLAEPGLTSSALWRPLPPPQVTAVATSRIQPCLDLSLPPDISVASAVHGDQGTRDGIYPGFAGGARAPAGRPRTATNAARNVGAASLAPDSLNPEMFTVGFGPLGRDGLEREAQLQRRHAEAEQQLQWQQVASGLQAGLLATSQRHAAAELWRPPVAAREAGQDSICADTQGNTGCIRGAIDGDEAAPMAQLVSMQQATVRQNPQADASQPQLQLQPRPRTQAPLVVLCRRPMDRDGPVLVLGAAQPPGGPGPAAAGAATATGEPVPPLHDGQGSRTRDPVAVAQEEVRVATTEAAMVAAATVEQRMQLLRLLRAHHVAQHTGAPVWRRGHTGD